MATTGSYAQGVELAVEFLPRRLLDFFLETLKSSAKDKCFTQAEVVVQNAYNEVAGRTSYYESYTQNGLEQLTNARRKAFLTIFTEFLVNEDNYK